jgi:hypothetical protein
VWHGIIENGKTDLKIGKIKSGFEASRKDSQNSHPLAASKTKNLAFDATKGQLRRIQISAA